MFVNLFSVGWKEWKLVTITCFSSRRGRLLCFSLSLMCLPLCSLYLPSINPHECVCSGSVDIVTLRGSKLLSHFSLLLVGYWSSFLSFCSCWWSRDRNVLRRAVAPAAAASAVIRSDGCSLAAAVPASVAPYPPVCTIDSRCALAFFFSLPLLSAVPCVVW